MWPAPKDYWHFNKIVIVIDGRRKCSGEPSRIKMTSLLFLSDPPQTVIS
jgi:hypothetical protein